ncbi:hypothetical protein [uncultured Corynebacterium sp.]|uniref:hypothetical protein n=1 Tax=uncultured Corynebacterium sp. TaxID=159447 RepID=UPI00263A0539|nr:hypothetical protein [uncultured Corynebacterium sp.]
MSGTSVRKAVAEVDLTAAAVSTGSSGSARAEQIAQLRSKMAQIGGAVPGGDGDGAGFAQKIADGEGVVSLGEQFRFLLPGGGLPRHAVTHMSDTPALVAEMLLHVVEAGGHAGVVGWPELSYAGIDPKYLGRIIAVPDPGVDPLGVAAVLTEGLDLVVYRSPVSLALSPVRCRPLLGKLRKGRAALMMVGATVPSPALTVTGDIQAFHGIGRGTGRITGVDIRVRAQSKGGHPASASITVGQAAVEASAPPVLKVVR